MKINEIINKTLSYHGELNRKLWNEDDELDPKVQSHLMMIANEFAQSLKIPDSAIKNYILTGSNANYNWTEYSDIDVHIIVDYSQICDGECKIDAADCLLAKKSLWNDRHDIEIYGHPVEVYASDLNDKLVDDAGCYSILRNEWIKRPAWRSVDLNSNAVITKADELAHEIDSLIASKTTDKESIVEITNKIWKYRQSGLERGGEFSVENLVFKTLRNNGYLDKIKSYERKMADSELSLGEAINKEVELKYFENTEVKVRVYPPQAGGEKISRRMLVI